MSATPAPPHAGHGTGLRVVIVTPEGLAYEGAAASVVVPGYDGEVAFLPHHAAYVGALGFGELRVTPPGGAPKRWFLEGGVAEVSANVVTVLAERVVPAEKVDAAAQRRLADTLELAHQLRGVPMTYKGPDLATGVAEFVREYGITHIVMGRSRRPWWRRLFGRSPLDDLLRAVSGVDVVLATAYREVCADA